jgi:hypothetical protein
MKHLIRIIFVIAIITNQWSIVNSQTLSPKVISTSGGYSTGGGNSLSWTMGETFSTTLTGGSNKLSQGEQQPEVQVLTGTIAASSFCAGSSATVPFTAYGIIGSSNVFTAQLSNSSGSFASAVNIGTLTGNASSAINVTIPAGTSAGTGYRIRVKSSLPAFNGKDNGMNIAISNAPPGIVTGGFTAPAFACNTSVSLITVTPVGGQNIHYYWNTGSNSSVVLFSTNIGGPFSPGSFSTPTNQVYAQFGAVGGGQSGYDVCVQGVNGCGSTVNRCIWIRGVVNSPGPITPANGVVACPNTSQPYSCGLSGGATLYTWTLAGSATPVTSGQGTPNVQVTFPNTFTSGQLCVTAALACGGASTSPARCITINNNPANPAIPSGVATVCPGANGVVYSVPAVTGASGYTWTVPANATIAAGANTPAVTVNFPTLYTGSNSVCVTATSVCGASAVKCKTVASGIPNQPAGITGPLTNVCNSTVQYSVVNPIASSYTWTNPAGTTISGSATGSTILLNFSPTFTSGVLIVAANSSMCAPATGTPRSSSTIWGRPNNPGAITANPNVFCSGGVVNFSVTPASPLPTYNWTISNGTIDAGQGSNNIDVIWGVNVAGMVSVRAMNGCGISAGTSSQSFSSGCREEGGGSAAAAFSVYPNPAHDNVTVSIDVKENTDFTLQLTDVSGRVILSQNVTGTAGLNTYHLNLTHLSKGVYMLYVQSASDNRKTKVVVE